MLPGGDEGQRGHQGMSKGTCHTGIAVGQMPSAPACLGWVLRETAPSSPLAFPLAKAYGEGGSNPATPGTPRLGMGPPQSATDAPVPAPNSPSVALIVHP